MELEQTLKVIGKNIRKRRLALNLTQEALGQRIGIDSRHVGFVERGTINATMKTLHKIADGLGLSLGDFFKRI